MTTPSLTRTAYRTCPLCEAGCGLDLTLAPDADGAERVTLIRGDRDDVFSHGFICPKGTTLGHLHEDPDRLRRPLVRRDGELVEVDLGRGVGRRRRRAAARHRRPRARAAVGLYVGNPNAHNIGGDGLPRPDAACVRHPQHVLGQHGRSASEGGVGRPDVRRPADDPGARHRSHRLPALPRRQPVCVERHRWRPRRTGRADRGDPRPRRLASWSSTRAARARPRSASGSRSGRARMRSCWRR